jgi:hypothetical protein
MLEHERATCATSAAWSPVATITTERAKSFRS